MGQEEGMEDRTVGRWQVGSMTGWKDERTGNRKEEGWREEEDKPYTTISSRGGLPQANSLLIAFTRAPLCLI